MKHNFMKYNFFPVLMTLLVIIIFLSSCTQSVETQTKPTTTIQPKQQTETKPTTTIQPKQQTETTKNIIEIKSSGFSPDTLTIRAGDAVTFVNKDSKPHWPASAVHPSHAVYPEAGGCIGSKFDACKGLAKDGTFLFTFNHKGTWRYHDHLNPGLQGVIIVD